MRANITVKIENAGNGSYWAQFSTSSNFSAAIITSNIQQADAYGLLKFTVSNLSPSENYWVRIMNSSTNLPVDNYLGRFRTPSSSTTESFQFAFGSCSDYRPFMVSASNHPVYDNIANKTNELDFFIHLGDIHYRDITQNNENLFQDAYDAVFAAPRQNNCWKNLPMYYIYDDHDFGPNDTDKNNPAKDAAIAAFRRRFPFPNPTQPTINPFVPYYSFVRGRVRFIVTDLRSEREPKGAFSSTSSQQKIFSDTQRDWFFNQLQQAKSARQIIIWANTKPWISSIQTGKDDWGGYHAARMEIVNYIEENDLKDSLMIISGDMHALAYDDGTSVNNYGDLKVCHAAAIDQEARPKGGPYTQGPIMQDSGTGWVSQYGIISVTDTGGSTIGINFKGIAINRISFVESTPIDVSFNLTPAEPAPITGTDPFSDYTTLLMNFNT